MDELEIKSVLRYTAPENGLTLNGLLRGLDQDKDLLMRYLVEMVFNALEEKAIESAFSLIVNKGEEDKQAMERERAYEWADDSAAKDLQNIHSRLKIQADFDFLFFLCYILLLEI
jgi:hypothetical protein